MIEKIIDSMTPNQLREQNKVLLEIIEHNGEEIASLNKRVAELVKEKNDTTAKLLWCEDQYEILAEEADIKHSFYHKLRRKAKMWANKLKEKLKDSDDS